jgi:acetyl esterase
VKNRQKLNIQSKHGHQIPIYVYTPLHMKSGCPVIVHFHGGGFVIGDPETYEHTTTKIANETGSVVISVDYRKAPENKFPAAHMDAIEATEWAYANASRFGGDPEKLVVMGDSAGGNLTACVSVELKNIVKLAIPIYPVIFFGVLSHSNLENVEAPILPAKRMYWFSLRYFNKREELSMEIACPLNRKSLAGTPTTHIITAKYDVLRDEGVEYYHALMKAGVRVTHKQYQDVHGFFAGSLFRYGNVAMKDICDVINQFFLTTYDGVSSGSTSTN